ncbi:MAG TPA: PQQ-binding-like beta-propeller repeat protein, partial [Vicinamibacteria bacterium]|nr:PQQ-binding-like beta-propeller repeat protein [Vicinamibacteria bacterium]
MIVLTTSLIVLLSAATMLVADDNWPQFRGSGGVVEDPTLPETWSATENVKWKASIPGRGWSSPVVWGDLIFLTSVASDGDEGPPEAGYYSGGQQDIPGGEHRWMVLAFDFETGELRWSREVHRGRPTEARHLKNSYASETAVADASRVYAYFGNLGVFAFTHEGEPAWDKRLEPHETRYGWGTAASPVLHQGTLFIVNDNEKDSYLLALEATTGKEKWRVSRDEKSNWSTPFVWENELRTELVTTGTNAVRSYDLDGNPLWQLSPMSSITIPTPVSEHGLLFLTSG